MNEGTVVWSQEKECLGEVGLLLHYTHPHSVCCVSSGPSVRDVLCPSIRDVLCVFWSQCEGCVVSQYKGCVVCLLVPV